MTRYPVVLEVTGSGETVQARATTSIELALDGGKSLQAALRSIETDYLVTLTAVKSVLASAGASTSRDPRFYWFVGLLLTQFIERLEAHGFYLVGKNRTPAKHVGMSATSVQSMMSFYRRYPDPYKIDPSLPWSAYRDRKEARRSKRP